jgi:hypothetical protein
VEGVQDHIAAFGAIIMRNKLAAGITDQSRLAARFELVEQLAHHCGLARARGAELVAHDSERIIIPTGYRTDYLSALKAFSHNGLTGPLIRMLDVAQSWTHKIDWTNLERARADLAATNAFAEGSDAKLRWG